MDGDKVREGLTFLVPLFLISAGGYIAGPYVDASTQFINVMGYLALIIAGVLAPYAFLLLGYGVVKAAEKFNKEDR